LNTQKEFLINVLILHINYLFLASKTIVMKFKFLLSAFSLMYLLSSCKNDSDTVVVKDTATIDGHPSWIMQGNIYEVNVRQYTPEGTFKAFEQHIDRLKEMGVQTLWFMPIHPISKLDRKGTLGSYYAVQSYVDVNPEFGTLEDWKSLVKKCHSQSKSRFIKFCWSRSILLISLIAFKAEK
jgi:hypothetical protein